MSRYERMTKAELIQAVHVLESRQEAGVVHELGLQQRKLLAQNSELRETQQLLQDSRDRYAQLYEFSPVGYLGMDADGYVRVLNLTAASILGAERARVVGKRFTDYIVADDHSRFEMHLRQCREGMHDVETELTLKRPDGTRAIELISVKPDDDTTDGVLYRTAMMDITDRKHAVEALRESERKLSWLIDNMPAVLWTKNEQGSPRYVSANVKHVLGYTEQEVRSGGARFWIANIHPDDRERVQTSYARLFSSGEGCGSAAYDIEYRRQAKDGSWVWVVDRGMSVSGENGVPYASGMFWDTSRRKRMQEQLRESEERFRQLAEHINDVFFLTDVDGSQIFYVSPAFEKLWGFSCDKLYRDPASWQELIHEADCARVRRAMKLRKRGSPYDTEFRIRRSNGAVRWIRLRGFPIHDASRRVYRFAGIAVDITARKEAAESLQRSHQRMRELALHLQNAREAERKRIAREIHDDLGALLLAVKMDLDAYGKRRDAREEGARTAMEMLAARVDTAIESVRRIATALRPSILDNVGVLAAVEWQAQDMERRTGITCEVEVDPGKDELAVDPDRATAIFRIVQEALANVTRHSEATHVKISLRERAGSVEVQITDNGKGFEGLGPPDFRRWGLVGMAERVGSFKGKFGITRANPHGTTVNVWIPAGPRAATGAPA